MTKFLKNKMRLDEYLVENEYFENLEIAKRQIMVGNIIVNEQKVDKPGEIISLDKIKSIRIKEKDIPYVSRGGLKLEKAIKVFELDFKDKIVLDIGASTGGFTDCSLQNGAKFVYAIDVGTNQLDWKLRNDSRVKSIENKHINDLEKKDLQNNIDIIVMDISFISIKKVLYKIKELLKENGFAIFLIKPQFEAERNEIEKGIVNDSNVHKRIINEVIEEAKINQLFLENLTVSPIRGTKGNIEYLAKFSNKNNFSSTEEIVNRLFNN
ncbi:TlyA family RNA methyltransferase [Fusobacterium hwasookii]|uniref:TlyA family RNA methyltransferase n=1 Tax=Fusobacterium hwasookii TaxID=1583098 RepID=UPI000495E5C2|nr:TlyA family RNA methyltransferase [Fusobacterium hwasookii]ALQ37115.1 RNA methyltransferase [Fusobacterium hwasookii ChDC F300]QNE67878.1 TlyA family RNA methyltransferase [Fusobacterium hwasookii]